MNENKILNSFLLGTFIFSAVSCDNNGDVQIEKMLEMDEDAIAENIVNQLHFISVKDRLQGDLTRAIAVNEDSDADIPEASNDDFSIVIVSFDHFRKKTGCYKGFGICNVTWFPTETLPDAKIDSIGEFSSIVEKQDNGFLYMDVLLAAPPTVSEPLPDLKVDEDVTTTSVTRSNFNEELVIVQGNYSFDSTLGNFGGYRINVEKY